LGQAHLSSSSLNCGPRGTWGVTQLPWQNIACPQAMACSGRNRV
jgi:hypothetical protein